MEKPKIGKRYNIFFKGTKQNGMGVLPTSATYTENGWVPDGYVSPEIMATIYRWELIDEPVLDPAGRRSA